jgi:hypothetical protein
MSYLIKVAFLSNVFRTPLPSVMSTNESHRGDRLHMRSHSDPIVVPCIRMSRNDFQNYIGFSGKKKKKSKFHSIEDTKQVLFCVLNVVVFLYFFSRRTPFVRQPSWMEGQTLSPVELQTKANDAKLSQDQSSIGMSYQRMGMSQFFCHQARCLFMPMNHPRVQRFHQAHFPKLLPILRLRLLFPEGLLLHNWSCPTSP